MTTTHFGLMMIALVMNRWIAQLDLVVLVDLLALDIAVVFRHHVMGGAALEVAGRMMAGVALEEAGCMMAGGQQQWVMQLW